jgi:hypothetical protein
MPASRALENWIFKIANDLNIDVKTERAGVVRNQIESKLENVLSTVEKNSVKA